MTGTLRHIGPPLMVGLLSILQAEPPAVGQQEVSSDLAEALELLTPHVTRAVYHDSAPEAQNLARLLESQCPLTPGATLAETRRQLEAQSEPRRQACLFPAILREIVSLEELFDAPRETPLLLPREWTLAHLRTGFFTYLPFTVEDHDHSTLVPRYLLLRLAAVRSLDAVVELFHLWFRATDFTAQTAILPFVASGLESVVNGPVGVGDQRRQGTDSGTLRLRGFARGMGCREHQKSCLRVRSLLAQLFWTLPRISGPQLPELVESIGRTPRAPSREIERWRDAVRLELALETAFAYTGDAREILAYLAAEPLPADSASDPPDRARRFRVLMDGYRLLLHDEALKIKKLGREDRANATLAAPVFYALWDVDWTRELLDVPDIGDADLERLRTEIELVDMFLDSAKNDLNRTTQWLQAYFYDTTHLH